MKGLLGYGHFLKIWSISKSEINLVPDLKREISLLCNMVSIILLVQLTSLILVFLHLNLLWTFGLSVIPTVFFSTYFLFLFLFNENKKNRLFILFLLLTISLMNGSTFLIYYFKEEMKLLNFGQQSNEDFYFRYIQLMELLNNEFYYAVFGAIIILFFVNTYCVPFFIVSNKSHKLLIQLKSINEQLRKKR